LTTVVHSSHRDEYFPASRPQNVRRIPTKNDWELDTQRLFAGRPRLGAAMTSVLVIDDDPIVLKGCRVLEDAGVQIVLEARDLVSGFRLYCRRHPDVLVMDLKMGAQNLGGLSLIRRIRLRDSRTQNLVFSMHDRSAIVRSALEAGLRVICSRTVHPRSWQGLSSRHGQASLTPSPGRHTGRSAVRQSTTRCVGEL
jgi:CheY-like chemotaxis protein